MMAIENKSEAQGTPDERIIRFLDERLEIDSVDPQAFPEAAPGDSEGGGCRSSEVGVRLADGRYVTLEAKVSRLPNGKMWVRDYLIMIQDAATEVANASRFITIKQREDGTWFSVTSIEDVNEEVAAFRDETQGATEEIREAGRRHADVTDAAEQATEQDVSIEELEKLINVISAGTIEMRPWGKKKL